MQPLFGAQFLNINFLSLLFLAALAPAVFATDIVPLTSIYASLDSHKLDFNIVVLNLFDFWCYTFRVRYHLF